MCEIRGDSMYEIQRKEDVEGRSDSMCMGCVCVRSLESKVSDLGSQ